jgi:prophage regulatory protein
MSKRISEQAELNRLIRLNEVLELLPISKSTWWEGVRTRKYPQPVRLGRRLTCWRLADILALVETGVRP